MATAVAVLLEIFAAAPPHSRGDAASRGYSRPLQTSTLQPVGVFVGAGQDDRLKATVGEPAPVGRDPRSMTGAFTWRVPFVTRDY